MKYIGVFFNNSCVLVFMICRPSPHLIAFTIRKKCRIGYSLTPGKLE